MEMKQAVLSLSALAQETRLAIYRLLVQAGPEGMAAGSIGEKLDLPPATLSFHLAGLTRAGLAQSRSVTVEDPATIEDRRAAGAESDEAIAQLSRLSDSDVSFFLERLPDAQRDALVLRFVLGMSAEEVGQAMNRRTEAVRALQSRGLRTLEQRLTAIGRGAGGRNRMPTRTRIRPAPVLASRRFALGSPMGQRHLAAFSRRSER